MFFVSGDSVDRALSLPGSPLSLLGSSIIKQNGGVEKSSSMKKSTLPRPKKARANSITTISLGNINHVKNITFNAGEKWPKHNNLIKIKIHKILIFR